MQTLHQQTDACLQDQWPRQILTKIPDKQVPQHLLPDEPIPLPLEHPQTLLQQIGDHPVQELVVEIDEVDRVSLGYPLQIAE